MPSGIYEAEMIEKLQREGWNKEHYLVMPQLLFFHKELIERDDLEEIIEDKNNHFIVYGSDWSSILFRDLMRQAGKKVDYFISISDGLCDDLSLFNEMHNYYVVVFDGIRKRKCLDLGVQEKKIIQFSFLDELQYFDKDVVPPHEVGKKEIFIDGGSMNLYTSGQFLKWCDGECEKIVAFEADKRCVDICMETKEKSLILKDITQIVPKGLWSEDGELEFSVVDNVGSSSFEIQPNAKQKDKILTTSIDQVLHGESATFIKMDIEGAELEALKGAKETIKKFKPILAISIYHKPEDIVTLPSYILELRSDYKLYLRNYHQDHTETVLYAI